MKRAELIRLMGDVAEALGRRRGSFVVDSRKFGKGWAVVLMCSHEAHFLDVTIRGKNEAETCEMTWFHVCRKLHDERQDAHERWLDWDQKAVLAKMTRDLMDRALVVETKRPAGAFVCQHDEKGKMTGMPFVPGPLVDRSKDNR